MIDVSKAIEPKSDQQNADDLLAGPRTIRINDVQMNEAAKEQKLWIRFDGDDGKPWKPSKTATRVLASIWGVDGAKWIGKHCTIYCDPAVTWAGQEVGGIRVSHMEGLDKPRKLMLTKTRGKKDGVTIQPLVVQGVEPVDHTAAQDNARKAARGGKAEFAKWWKENQESRAGANLIIDELKAISAEADAQNDEGAV